MVARHVRGFAGLVATIAVLAVGATPAAAATLVRFGAVNPVAYSFEADCDGTVQSSVANGSFEVTRDAPFDAPLDVAYTVAGPSDAGVDYEALSGVVTLAAGEPSAVVEVVPIASGSFGGITVTLTDTADATADGQQSAAVDLAAISNPGPICDEYAFGSVVPALIVLHPECNVHGVEVSSEPAPPTDAQVEVLRSPANANVAGAVAYEVRDPAGLRPTVTGTLDFPAGLVSSVITVPGSPDPSILEVVLVRQPEVYGVAGVDTVLAETGLVQTSACSGPYEIRSQTLALQLGDALPPLSYALEGVRGGETQIRLASGQLPAGITVTPAGEFVGTVQSAGTWSFALVACQVSATDEACGSPAPFLVTVAAAAVPDALPATGLGGDRLLLLSLVALLAGIGLQRRTRDLVIATPRPR